MTNTHNKINRVGFLLPLFYLIAPTLAALRSIACINDIDAGGMGYFGDSTLMRACNIAAAIFTAIFFLHVFTGSKKDSLPHESFSNTPTYIVSGILGAAIILAIYELISPFITSGAPTKIGTTGVVSIVSAVLGAAALAFLLLNAIVEKKHSQIRAALGIAASLFFTSYGAYVYFDTSVAPNMQQRILTVLALVTAATFMLYETRIPLGHSKWHSYAAFGLMASLLLSYSAIPALVYYIANGAMIPGATLTQLGVSATAAIYIITRVTIIATAPEDEVCDLAETILDMAHRRK